MATTFNHDAIRMIATGVMNTKQLALLIQADMLDPESPISDLQQTRVCAFLKDAQEWLMKGDPAERKNMEQRGLNEPVGLAEFGLEQIKAENYDVWKNGGQFTHEGCAYQVELTLTPCLEDEKGNPYPGKYFDAIRRIDAKKEELTKKQSSLTLERKRAVKDLIDNNPCVRFSESRKLKVIR